MSNQKVVKNVIRIIERDHPIISRRSCVIDILLWEARRLGKEPVVLIYAPDYG